MRRQPANSTTSDSQRTSGRNFPGRIVSRDHLNASTWAAPTGECGEALIGAERGGRASSRKPARLIFFTVRQNPTFSCEPGAVKAAPHPRTARGPASAPPIVVYSNETGGRNARSVSLQDKGRGRSTDRPVATFFCALRSPPAVTWPAPQRPSPRQRPVRDWPRESQLERSRRSASSQRRSAALCHRAP